MELPVVIEPLADGSGVNAQLGGPFHLSAAAATPEEAIRQLAVLLQHRLQLGMELRTHRTGYDQGGGRRLAS